MLLDTKAERKAVHDLHVDLTSTNAPYVLMVMGSDSQAIIYFYAKCADGSSTTNSTSPCYSSNPIKQFHVNVYPEGFEAVNVCSYAMRKNPKN